MFRSEPTSNKPILFVIYGSGNEQKITVTVEYIQLKTAPVWQYLQHNFWIQIQIDH